MTLHDLPTLNAMLNGTSTILLLAGFFFIRQKRINAHKTCMLSACVVSTLFLISYIIYHNQVGFTRFAGEGLIRVIYFSILIPHTVLAMVAVGPLVLITLFFAVRGSFGRHRRVARWTLPIWLYVSVSGVAIYWMLYRM